MENEIYKEGSEEQMIVLGANVLGILLIAAWVGFVTFVFYILIKLCLLRVSRTTEIVGSDVWQLAMGNEGVQNFLRVTIDEAYPRESGSYLKQKSKLLLQEKRQRTHLKEGQLKRLVLMAEEQLKETMG